jgi:hypothetical protein
MTEIGRISLSSGLDLKVVIIVTIVTEVIMIEDMMIRVVGMTEDVRKKEVVMTTVKEVTTVPVLVIMIEDMEKRIDLMDLTMTLSITEEVTMTTGGKSHVMKMKNKRSMKVGEMTGGTTLMKDQVLRDKDTRRTVIEEAITMTRLMMILSLEVRMPSPETDPCLGLPCMRMTSSLETSLLETFRPFPGTREVLP